MSEGQSSEIILFTIISLLFIYLVYELKKLMKFPAAPLLLAAGVILRVVGALLGGLAPAVKVVDHIDPHFIMLGIMPALIFEASLDIEWFTFKNEFWQIIPMATTVVLGCTFLNAAIVKILFGEAFLWSEACILGVILSATDHVAVCAILKEIYADKRLETLISGETMLNEAAVIVIFYMFLHGEASGVSDWVPEFGRLLIGGAVVGLLGAFGIGYLLNKTVNDDTQELSLTLVGTYLIFYVADATALHVSGAIAVSVWGLYMSAYGRTLISQTCEKSLHSFWKVIGKNIEGLVFTIGGMLLGMGILEEGKWGLIDLLRVLVLFVALYLVRGVVILAHYPLISNLGYGMNMKEYVVVVFSGTKGGISIVLALIVMHYPVIPAVVRHQIVYYTVILSVLTIVFSSFAVKYLVHALGLESLNEIQEHMMIGVTESLIQKIKAKISRMKKDKDYSLVNWGKVCEIAGPKRLLVQILNETRNGKRILWRSPGADDTVLLSDFKDSSSQLSEAGMERETRRRFLTTLKGLYWHEYESGRCQANSAIILSISVDKKLDKDDQPMNDWETVERAASQQKIVKLFFGLSKVPFIGEFFRNWIYQRISLTYDVCNTFIKCHTEAILLLHEMEIDLNKQLFVNIAAEAQQNIDLCSKYQQDNISGKYTDLIEVVQSNVACQVLLRYQRKSVERIYKNGVIEEIEYEHLINAIDSGIKLLAFHQEPEIPSLKSLLMKRFSNLNDFTAEQLIEEIKEIHFEDGAMLFEEESEAKGAYLILNGTVHEWSHWIEQDLHMGNIVGVQNLLPNIKSTCTSAQAKSIVRVAYIPDSCISNEHLIEDLYTEAAEEILLYHRGDFSLENATQAQVYKIVKNSVVVRLAKNTQFVFANGCFVLTGKIGDVSAYGWVPPNPEMCRIRHESIVLLLPSGFANLIRIHHDLRTATRFFGLKNSVRKLDSLRTEAVGQHLFGRVASVYPS